MSMNGNPLAAGGPPGEALPPPMAGPAGPMAGGGGGENAIAGPPAASPHPILAAAQQNLAGEQAKYDKLSKAQKQSTMVRSQMDQLMKLGDAVTADDVVEGLGKMVAGGLSPEPLIAMMSGDPKSGEPPMPESGSGLASWLQAHEQKFVQFEQQIAQAHSSAAHAVGMAGVQGLVAHHIEMEKEAQGQSAGQLSGQSAGQLSGPPNPLLQ